MTSSERLAVARSVREALDQHAEEGAPAEVCGVLAGDRGNGRVLTHRRVTNVAADPRSRYELDPEATLRTVEALEAEGRDVVGFYHSHPAGPAEPSGVDRRQATWEGYVYCIVVPGGEFGAWRWTGERFEPLEVMVVDGADDGT